MTMTIAFDNNKHRQLATNQGYNDLSDWVSSLPVRLFPHLTALVYHGYTNRIPMLIAETNEAYKRYPIHEPTLKSTLKNMISILRENERSAEVVMVTYGIIPNPEDFRKKNH